MVYYKTSILMDEDPKKMTPTSTTSESGVGAGGNSLAAAAANNNGSGRRKGSGGIVFKSLCVDKASKTPYSDATQVRKRDIEIGIYHTG